MATPQGPQPPQPVSWRDAAIARSEIITDAWEVTKTYAGRAAEWVLFFCMIANIVEILPSFHMWEWLQNAVLGTQAITLDIAGFGLASMGEQARQMGDERAARQAETTGKLLIGIMILTLLLVSVGLLFPPAKPWTDLMEKGLILVRVVMTVIYGHVIHSLRRSGQTHREEQERALAELRAQLQQRITELSEVRQHVTQRESEQAHLVRQLREQTQQREGQETLIGDLRAQLDQAVAALSTEQQTAARREEDQSRTIQELREQLASMERAQSALLAGTEGQADLIKQLQTHLAQATERVQQIAPALEEKQRECERLTIDLHHALDERDTFQQDNQRLSAELEAAAAQVADLTAKVEQIEKQYSALRVKVQSESASEQGQKSERGRYAHAVKARGVKAGKITPIDQARVKQKTSDAEVLAYMAEHPGMRVPAVAAHFAVTSRTIYNILKRQAREPEREDATEAQS